MLTANMLKKKYLSLLLIAVGTGLVLLMLMKFLRKENFESYKQEIKELARQSDIAKDKYPQQSNSQDSISEQQHDAAKNLAVAQQLVTDFQDLQPDDLLPHDEEVDEWSKVNPKGQGSLEDKNFLEAGYHIGVDTQANSLRNANRQIRSEPPNPQKPVSIWQNSTISPDPFRKQLEIN